MILLSVQRAVGRGEGLVKNFKELGLSNSHRDVSWMDESILNFTNNCLNGVTGILSHDICWGR